MCVIALAFMPVACTLAIDWASFRVEAPSTGEEEAGGDSSTPDGRGLPIVTDASVVDSEAGPECQGSKGPQPVRVGDYCIDSTEVTNGDYAEFLAAKTGDTSGQPPECAWNTSFAPGFTAAKTVPVRGPDWCDALAYCAWAGKRLCGRIGGGPLPSNLRENAAADEWFRVCTKDGTRAYPYGSTFSVDACNCDKPGGAVPVKSFATCEGGYPGIFDMAGNLWEWENSCADGGATAACAVRGGSYANNSMGDCKSTLTPTRDRATVTDVTIRCCSDLTPH